jgi:hypothetical protein
MAATISSRASASAGRLYTRALSSSGSSDIAPVTTALPESAPRCPQRSAQIRSASSVARLRSARQPQIHSVLESSSESQIFSSNTPSRRSLLVSTGLSLTMASAVHDGGSSASAAEMDTFPLLKVPKGKEIAPGLAPSAVIKGCWQLAGGLQSQW